MIFFDKFDESNFDIDSQELDIQAVTVSEVKKEYAELGTLRFWPQGEQAARKDGKIISRTYKELSFADNAIDYDFVDLGYIDPTIGDRYQWRIVQEFTEKEWYSSCDPSFGDFKIWEYSINEYQMEITYNNTVTSFNDAGTPFDEDDDPKAVFTWNRPKETISTTGLGCPGLGIAPPNETGPGSWVSLGTFTSGVGQNALNNTSCERYTSLPKPFYRVYDAGKSLGAVKGTTDLQPDNVYISDQPDLDGDYEVPTGAGSFSDPYRMKKRYIIFEWFDPGRTTLTTFELLFVGNEVFRIFTPISRDEDPECPEHLDETPYIAHASIGTPTRYKPPNQYNFPDNFWNDTVDTVIEDFNGRSQATPGPLNS